MRKYGLLLAALGFFSLHASAQDSPANPPTTSVGYVRCPAGQSNVFLYQSVTVFEVVSSPKCEDRVDVLGKVDTLGGYLRVRTADGKEGYLPQDQVTSIAPVKSKIAIVETPTTIPAGNASILSGPLNGNSRSLGYDIPKVEAFGGYSYMNADWESLANRSALQGWDGSVVFNVTPLIAVEGNASGNYQTNCVGATGLTCSVLTFMGGPKITVHRGASITAFGHGLVGLGALTMSLAGSPLTTKDLAWAAGGGVDYAVTNRFSVRLGQFDYLRTQYLSSLGGTHQNNFRVSAGIVIRLGKLVTE